MTERDTMKENLVQHCSEIVRIPSESGREKDAALFVKTVMESLGFDRVWIDRLGSVIGVVDGSGPMTVMMEGHLDTVGVPEPDAWSVPPFGGEVRCERLYGRGTSDMKSALMAMVYAAADFIPRKSELNGSIVVAGVVCEEIFEGVAQGEVLDQVQPDLVIIGEASELDLCIGQRGRAEIQVTVYGKSAHSARPEAGINAVKNMCRLIERIDTLVLPYDKFLGPAIQELTDVISSPYPGASVIPEKCTATYDRRLLPGETEDSVLAPIRDIIDDLRQTDPEFRADARIVEADLVCYTGETISARRFFPAWHFPENAYFVEAASRGLKTGGFDSRFSHYSFCTDGSQSAGVRGIPTVGFGPSRENLAHVVDEYIEIDQLLKAYHGYIAMLSEIINGENR